MVNLVISMTGLIICVLGLIQVLRSRPLDKRTRNYLLQFFFVLIAYVSMDLISQVTSEIPGKGWILTSQLCLFFESLFSAALIPLISSFLLYSCGEESPWRNPVLRLVMILLIIYTGLLIYAQFTKNIYYYDEMNVYHRGPWYPVLLAPPVLMMLLNLGLLWNKRNKLSSRKTMAFAAYILIPGLAMVIQMLFYGILVIVLGTSIAAFIMLTYVMNEQTELYYGQQIENSRLKTEIMLSQIQPHFLFNTLGTISHLCNGAPEAKEAILQFSRYLRGNIDVLSNESRIPFSKELEHTRLYLDLEKLRFQDSLQVVYGLECTDFMIPTLTLQPLVENAVRHGVRGNADGCGTVEICSCEDDDCYMISVKDNGPGFSPDNNRSMDDRSHIGIANVRERLKSICAGRLEITSSPGQGSLVKIIIPKEKDHT